MAETTSQEGKYGGKPGRLPRRQETRGGPAHFGCHTRQETQGKPAPFGCPTRLDLDIDLFSAVSISFKTTKAYRTCVVTRISPSLSNSLSLSDIPVFWEGLVRIATMSQGGRQGN
jgi:hypothetical protein